MKHITKIILIVFIMMNAAAFYRVGFDSLITFYEHFLISAFGAFMFCFALFRIEKNKQEKLHIKINRDEYTDENWEDWAWTFMFCFPITYYGESVFAAIGTYFTIPIYDFYYLGAGPLSVVVGYGLNWLLQKFA